MDGADWNWQATLLPIPMSQVRQIALTVDGLFLKRLGSESKHKNQNLWGADADELGENEYFETSSFRRIGEDWILV